jgi:transcriptional regulator with XRE-family HTH domain
MPVQNGRKDLGRVLKQRRLMVPLTLRELALSSGTSPSHLVRIEKSQRFPSASILQKLARPLGFEETELLHLAGYLSEPSVSSVSEDSPKYNPGKIVPHVREALSRESYEVQELTISLLGIMKALARSL